MDAFLKDIIDKYKEFNEFLNNLDIKSFEKFNRVELKEFYDCLIENNQRRYLSLEINKLMEKKKKEEFPQLLKVHNYPMLNKIDFLSEEEKIKLDNLLLSFGKSSYFGATNRKWRDFIDNFENKNEISEKILKFLLDNKMISTSYEIELCCNRAVVTYEQLEKIIRCKELLLKEDKSNSHYAEIEDLKMNMPYDIDFSEDGCQYCLDCGDEIDISLNEYKDMLNSHLSQCYCKLIVDRDKSFDNV